MRKSLGNNGKISIKIFLVTAVTFTALLIAALFAQSYFYEKSYNIYKRSDFDIAFNELKKELRREGVGAEKVTEILIKYRDSDNVWAVLFSSDRITEKYAPEELPGYEYSEDFIKAIAYYKETLSPLINNSNTSFGGDREFNGHRYAVVAIDIFSNGEVLFAIGPASDNSTPGLVDQYFWYILFIGATVSFIVSYLLSVTLSRPLIKITAAARKMAKLDFSEKITVKSNDELGQLSDSLNALSEKLDGTLNDLTAANARLAKDIEKERNLEKTRKEFVANVSHELKTPLAIIKGYSEAIKDNIRADKKERYIERIVQEADDMNQLVQDMLDLTHIEAGRYKLQKTDFDLVMLTGHIIQSLHFLASAKELRTDAVFSRQEIYIHADRIKIGQVITNFLHNAIRHTPVRGHIRVSVTENAHTVRFAVENEGDCIHPEKLDKVWERFYRETEDRSKKTGGSGLGLAITATILTLHGMNYGAENTETGVVFYFECSLQNQAAPPV